MVENELITTKQAMKVLSLSYDGFNRCLLNGKIQPAIKVGTKNYFDIEDVHKLLDERNAANKYKFKPA